MRRYHIYQKNVVTVFLLVAFALATDAYGSDASVGLQNGQAIPSTADYRAPYCVAYHGIGRLGLYVDNSAYIWGDPLWDPSDLVCSHSTPRLNGEFPLGSNCMYLWRAGIWIGGIVGRDTLVSASAMDIYSTLYSGGEFAAIEPPDGQIQYRSTRELQYLSGAKSEQDYVAMVADTLIDPSNPFPPDVVEPWRSHIPLRIKLHLRSYSWSTVLANDFILFDWEIENIGTDPITGLYVGLYADPDVYFRIDAAVLGSSTDDICGILESFTFDGRCPSLDTLNIAWAADNDGDPVDGAFANSPSYRSPTGVIGFHWLGHPERNCDLSYNWWITNPDPQYDFGPRSKYQFRSFANGRLGNPEGDRNAYYQMRNGEHDYDLVEMSKITTDDPVWQYPSGGMTSLYSHGGDVRHLISVGPVDLAPGEFRSIPFSVVGGDGLHSDPENGERLLGGDIGGFRAHLNFADLAANARMAEWIYDNPGVDTDSDGYFGRYDVCVLDSQLVGGVYQPILAETTWVEGDGVPDWRAVGAPPPPRVWLYPGDGRIRVRFNGYRSETTPDLATGAQDFEGYNVYLGRDDRETSLSIFATFDLFNFDKYVYRATSDNSNHFEIREVPFALETLRCLYGLTENPCVDSVFDPLQYNQSNPYRIAGFGNDSIFYFVQHGYNASRLGIDTPIRKLYPNQPRPIPGEPIPDSAYTEDGYLKYYEYECVIDDLLPTVPYYINVTAFDYGDPSGGVEALESSKLLGLQDCYALENANQTGATNKPVYIYPNPYRADANYRDMGYEGRGSGRIDDRERRIHFANLPAKCWIRIHTLDGDMVREIRHDMDPNDPASDHDTWDLINRNIMAVESGLYYWSVEPDSGPVQIGKLVIIR